MKLKPGLTNRQLRDFKLALMQVFLLNAVSKQILTELVDSEETPYIKKMISAYDSLLIVAEEFTTHPSTKWMPKNVNSAQLESIQDFLTSFVQLETDEATLFTSIGAFFRQLVKTAKKDNLAIAKYEALVALLHMELDADTSKGVSIFTYDKTNNTLQVVVPSFTATITPIAYYNTIMTYGNKEIA